MTDKEIVLRSANIVLARKSFWHYCHIMKPDMYDEVKSPYLKTICDGMQSWYESDKQILVINLPPRHGKSETATMFIQWALGNNNKLKIMSASYNERLSEKFSMKIRNAIMTENPYVDKIGYNDIFPDTKVQYGNATKSRWSLEGNDENYLATSPNGSATGMGCSLMVIDDLIKESKEVFNKKLMDDYYDWLTDTMLSRFEVSGIKLVIIMTQWGKEDLCNRVLNRFPSLGYDIEHICMPIETDGVMLSECALTKADWELKKKTLSKHIMLANYYQECIDLDGALYTQFTTYGANSELRFPAIFDNGNKIYCQVDTADKGSDYYCAVFYGIKDKLCYIVDILYDDRQQSIVTPLLIDMCIKNNCKHIDIESNNGGSIIADNINLEFRKRGYSCVVKPFHQKENKEGKILSTDTEVMTKLIFPEDWDRRYSKFYEDMKTFQREFKINSHDDCADVCAEIVLKNYKKSNIAYIPKSNIFA